LFSIILYYILTNVWCLVHLSHYEDGYTLSAMHSYDIQVFIAKSLCQTVCTPFLQW
ncbi:hypothetical protein BgiBS90_031278, partial [Biomphalaria glabrata]